MAQNINELYTQLSKDEKFPFYFKSQPEFEEFLNNEQNADSIIEDLFDVKGATEFVKKKDQTSIPNPEEESFSSPSPLVGQTEPVVAEPEKNINTDFESAGVTQEDLGYSLLPKLGYGKSFEAAETGSGPIDPKRLAFFKGSLDGILERSKTSSGGIYLLTEELGKLRYDADYQGALAQGKLKESFNNINAYVSEIYQKNPKMFSDVKVQESLKRLGIENPVEKNPSILQKQQSAYPSYVPPTITRTPKNINQIFEEKQVVPSKDDELESFYANYLATGNEFQPGELQLASSSMKKQTEQNADKILASEAKRAIELAGNNIPANFFDQPAIVNGEINPNRRLSYKNGLYFINDRGNVKINDVALDSAVESILSNPVGGVLSPKLLEVLESRFDLDREKAADILKPRLLRLVKEQAQENLNTIMVDRELEKIDANAKVKLETASRAMGKVAKEQEKEINLLVAKGENLVFSERNKINKEIKDFDAAIKTNYESDVANRYAMYTGTVNATPGMSKEQNQALYQDFLASVNEMTTQAEEERLAFTTEKQKELDKYVVSIKAQAKADLAEINKKYANDTEEKKKETAALYRNLEDKYKVAFEKVQEEESKNSGALGMGLTDILQSRSAGVTANAITALTAAVGYEDNPFTGLLKYLNVVQSKSSVPIEQFSKVLEEDGLFSQATLKNVVQQIVQQGVNMAPAMAATMLTGNPYIGGAIGWSQDTLDQIGEAYNTVFEKTGSIDEAEDAAATSLKVQLLLAPTYALEMMPFAKGYLSRMASGTGLVGFAKKAAVGITIEQGTETVQETVQQYITYLNTTDDAIPKSYLGWTYENGLTTAIDILPATVVLGGISAGVEAYSETILEKTKTRVLKRLEDAGMSQVVVDMLQVIGDKSINIIPEYLFRGGVISKEEFAEMRSVFSEVVKSFPQSKQLLADTDKQKYYVSLQVKKKKLQTLMENAEDVSVKGNFEKQIEQVTKETEALVTGKEVNFSKVTFANGSTVVLSDAELISQFGRQNFLNDLASEEITVTSTNSKVNSIIETTKANLKKSADERTVLEGPQTIVGIETAATNLGAVVDNAEKLAEVSEKARQAGQQNTDRIVQETTRMQKILDTISPGVKIVLMNTAEYQQAVGSLKGKESSFGNISITETKDGLGVEIQINLDSAQNNTVGHEVSHAILLKTLGDNPALFNDMKQGIERSVSKALGNSSAERILEFIKGYSTMDQSEEFLVETASLLAQEGKNLDLTVLEKIARVVSDFVAKITGGKIQLYNSIRSKEGFIDYMNALADTLRTGNVSEKLKTNAVQEQTTGQVPVQSETTVGQEVVQGESRSKSQETTQESQEVKSKSQVVYHAGTLQGTGNVYVTPDRQQADAYGRESGDSVIELNVDSTQLASEDYVKTKIEELGYTSPGGTIDELMIPMLMDERFDDTALKPEEVENIKNILKEEGYTGISFMDEDVLQRRKEGVENYLIFDTKDLQKPNEGREVKSKSQETKKSTDSSKILSEKLTKQELNTVRSSLRQTIPDGLTIEILDAISSERDYDSGNEGLNDTIERVKEEGLSFRDLVNIAMQDEELLDKKNLNNRSAVISYLLNVGELGRLQAMASRAVEKGQEVSSKSQVAGVTEESILSQLENPLTTEQVEGRQIEEGFEVFDKLITIDSSKGKTNRKPNLSKSQVRKDYTIEPSDFADIEFINGKRMMGFMGDTQLAGTVTSPTGVELDGSGGPNYIAWANRNIKKDKNGFFKGRAAVWASTFEDSTRKLLKKMQSAQGALIGAQQITGILGNRRMLLYFGEELKLAAEKNSETDILNLINSKIQEQFKKDISFSKALGGATNFNTIEEFIDYLDPYFTSDQFVAKYPNSENITQNAEGKKITLLEATNKTKKPKPVSYEVRGAFFNKVFNVTNYEKFGLPFLAPSKKYKDIKSVLEYANEEMYKDAGYGDFVGFVEFDPKTLKLEKVNTSSDFYNPSYEWVITAEKVRHKYLNEFIDGRALFYDSASVSKDANQTPFGLRPKDAAARAIMGSQPVTTIDATRVKEKQTGFTSKSQLTTPSSGNWSPSLTQAQVDEVVGGDFGNTLDEKVKAGKKHSTQIATTVGTYNKWASWLEQNVPNFKNAKVLDVGAGLGHIHKAFKGKTDNVESYEPFYDKEQYQKYAGVQKPNYSKMDASDVPAGQYDVVVNNAVLNVVPADIRESIVNTIGNAIKPGGIGILNSMSQDYLNSLIKKIDSGASKNIKLSDTEVFVRESGKNSYQKGWTNQELQSYVQDVLGSGFTVEKAPSAITSMATVLIRKNEAQSKSQQVEATETDFRLPFGKFQGQWYTTTPKSYRDWLSKQPWFDPRVYLKKPETRSKSQVDYTQIKPEYDRVLNSQFGTKVDAYTSLINIGYSPKKIKEALGLFEFDEAALAQAQGQIAIETMDKVKTLFGDRQEEIKTQINNNLGLIENIYEDLIADGFSPLEIFTAARDMDFMTVEEMKDLFGAEYRQTVQNALDRDTEYPSDFLDDLEQDAKNLKVEQKAAEIADVLREVGLGLTDSAVTIDMFLEYLKTNGFDQIAIQLVNGVKQFSQDRGLLTKAGDWASSVTAGSFGDKLYTPEAINYAMQTASELFSQAGRVLQMARFFNREGSLNIIEKQLSNSGVILTTKQRETLVALLNDYQAAQDRNKTLLTELEQDWSDKAFEAYFDSEKQIGLATIRVAQFLDARKPGFYNEKITSGGSRALLGIATTVLSRVANIENNLLSTNYLAKSFQKLRDNLGGGIKASTLSPRNWAMARSLSKKRAAFDVSNNVKYGQINTNKGLNRYYDNLGQVNFFKDPMWVYKFFDVIILKSTGKSMSEMTQEEQVDAFDLTLTKLKDGTIEMRDGKGYTFARSLAWSVGLGPALAVGRQNPSLLAASLGPVATEFTGRVMSYGGDISFGYMAAQRSMIDYFQNIKGTRFQDGVFDSMLKDVNGKLDKEAIRALSTILRADGDLYSKFEQEGLRRTLLGDNFLSGGISLVRGGIQKGVRTLYAENRRNVPGEGISSELKRQFTLRGAGKNLLQLTDIALWTLMPFTKVPVNFLGAAVAKTVPHLSFPKYLFSESIYQYKFKEFNKKFPIGKKLSSDTARKQYELAKIDLFMAKRQTTYDAAQAVTSLGIYAFSMSAITAGAILAKEEPEKEKQLKNAQLRGGLYNATLHREYLVYQAKGLLGGPKTPEAFIASRGGYALPGDIIMNTNNLGFVGYGMNLYGSVDNADRKRKANGMTQLLDEEKSMFGLLVQSAIGGGIENLPMFQGLARIGELVNDFKDPDEAGKAVDNFISSTLSTSMAVFFPSVFSVMSKGYGETVQSNSEIFPERETATWTNMWGPVTIRVVQKLNRNISFNENTRNEFYEAAIGPFGEDLSYKVTYADPGTAGAYFQAIFDPFAIRSYDATSRYKEDEKNRYVEAATLNAGLINLGLMYQQMTGRDYVFTVDGKKSGFYQIMSNAMKNQFKWSEDIITGIDGGDINRANFVEYTLPNDLYRKELKERGETMRMSLRSQGADIIDTIIPQIQNYVNSDRTDEARLVIENFFEQYQDAISQAKSDYTSEYKTQRETGYLREMNRRGLISPEMMQKLKRAGVADTQGRIL